MSRKKKYPIRDLLALSYEDLWNLPETHHTVVFDDGVVDTHTRSTIITVYLLYPYVEFPELNIYKRYHLADRRFSSKIVLKILEDVVWTIFFDHREQIDHEWMAKAAFVTANRFYNDMTVKLASYVTTMSLFDCVDVMTHPEVAKANREVEPNQHSIAQVCYPRITKALMNDPGLNGNPIAEAARSGTLKLNQILQCVGPRGYVTDVDSSIFPQPITRGYVEGLDTLHDQLTESRSGTKSLMFNRDLLKKTETFNRENQLITQTVRNLNRRDCHSPHLIEIPVTKTTLPLLRGKYQVCKKTGQMSPMTGREEDLLGTTVRIRSVLGCIDSDDVGVCSVCYGQLAHSLPHGTNVGQYSAVSVGDKVTSSVLSVKHSEQTSSVERFDLDWPENKYLKYGEEEDILYLRSFPQTAAKITLTIARNEATTLADINIFKSLQGISVEQFTSMTEILLTFTDDDGEIHGQQLKVSFYNLNASLSREFLEYVRKQKWSHDVRNNILIDITNFDITKPFLILPYKHVNMYQVAVKIQRFLQSGSGGAARTLGHAKDGIRRKKQVNLKSYQDPVEGLLAFLHLINEKLHVNIVHCEILVYAMLVRDARDGDYRLPKPGVSGHFERYSTIMSKRSLGVLMAYQNQREVIHTPDAFVRKHIPPHPYDLLLMGGNYLGQYGSESEH